jgi:hypothetical protein
MPKPLAGGRLIHDGLEGYYTHKAEGHALSDCTSMGMDAILRNYSEFNQETKDGLAQDSHRNPERLTRAIWDYAENYQQELFDPRKDLIEKGFALVIPEYDIGYVGRVDVVGIYGGMKNLAAYEHKHTIRMNANYFDQFFPSWQIGGYMWALSEYLQDFWGMVINAIVIHKIPKSPKKGEKYTLFERRTLMHTMQEWKISDFIQNLQGLVHSMLDAFKQKERGFWKNQGYCGAYFRTCDYHPLCICATRKALEKRMETDYLYEPWFPYDELVKGATKEYGEYSAD